MKKTDNIPLWVYLAFSAIETRKGALLLTAACAVFTLYCFPWPRFFTDPAWLVESFLFRDWDWFLMMIPITGWYWISLKWVDRHLGWADTASKE